jgi:thiol:disulfide interchange protein
VTSGFFWLAASTGLLSLLTPCVFPMVPVTLAYFSGSRNRAGDVRRAVLFGLGIVLTFTVLGLALAGIFGAAGLNRFAANPWLNLTLAALFALFAANLFDVLATPVPWKILNSVEKSARDAAPGSSLGALLMGATFTLTSVTCTAPFVGTLLVLAARGSWSTPVAGMLVYSTFFALPFFFLALAPGLISRLPRAGDWMHRLRVLIGLLELGAAVKFVSNADLVLGWGVVTRNVVLIAWGLLALAGAGYLGFAFWNHRGRGKWSAIAVAPIAATLVLAAWLFSGLNGRKLPQIEAFLPPANGTTLLANATTLSPTWMLNDYPAALVAARSTGKPVFIDFTGYTCTNCRWMEANVFSRPDVGGALGQFVLSRLYTDGDGPIYEQQQAFQEKKFGTVALPLYAIVDAGGEVRATFSGLTRDPSEFVAFLRRGLAASNTGG